MKPFTSLLFVVAAFVTVQGLSDEINANIAMLSKACIDETKVSTGEVEKLRNNDWSSNDVTVRDYFKCLSKKTVLDKNRKFKDELIASSVSESERQKVSDTLNRCDKQVREVTLDTVWDYGKCYFSALPEYAAVVF